MDRMSEKMAGHRGFGDVLLVGVGSSTLAAGAYLQGLPEGSLSSLTLFAGNAGDKVLAQAQGLVDRGARLVTGEAAVGGHFDLGVVSPGIPQTGDLYRSAAAACDELVSEPELAWQESPRDWVGITGTNGKTTTTTLTARLLEAAGIPARPVGNIGLPPIACVADRREREVFVAELSSFQLASTKLFEPRVGVLLNVTPDHVEWHGSLEAYAQAKQRIFSRMGGRDLAVLGDDGACARAAAELEGRGLRVCRLLAQGAPAPAACAADAGWLDGQGRLVVRLDGRDHVLAPFADMCLKGAHNIQNSLAAAACALEMGAGDEDVIRGLLAFEPLEHRIEPCGRSRAGVFFSDDSKGTNTDATEKALGAFAPGSVVLLAGGHDKGTDLTSLATRCAQACRLVIAYGEAGTRLAQALDAAGCQVVRAPHMREAFDAAVEAARPGETVLLSPACSSYDEFSGYEERGRVFKGWVADLLAQEGAR